jgi:hypothetical protein
MGWINAGTYGKGKHLCKHKEDISRNTCPLCEKEKQEAFEKSQKEYILEQEKRQNIIKARCIPLADADIVKEVNEWEEGWISKEKYLELVKDCSEQPVFDPETRTVYQYIGGMSWEWR